MRVAIFSNHKYDQNSFEVANGSFRHELVFLTATLESATASLASGFPAVRVFVNDRLDRAACRSALSSPCRTSKSKQDAKRRKRVLRPSSGLRSGLLLTRPDGACGLSRC
jgi:hypothetical protein